jgi:hypothetical protein
MTVRGLIFFLKLAFGRVLELKSGSPLLLPDKVLACIQTNAAMHRSLLQWVISGQTAPAKIEFCPLLPSQLNRSMQHRR